MLAGKAQKRVRRRRAAAGTQEQELNSTDEEDGGGDVVQRTWSKKNPRLVGSKIPDFERRELPAEIVTAAKDYDAYEYYKLFQPDDYVEKILEQSLLYAGQKDLQKAAANISMDTYR
jgi:hypothetical protein